MKRVQLSVGYIEGRGLKPGVILVGVMDNEYLYVRKVCEETFWNQHDYLKIRKDLTVANAGNGEAECRSISVALEIGLSDERFQTIKNNPAVVAEIEKSVADFERTAIDQP